MTAYELAAKQAADQYKHKKNQLILAIETSCDETAAAVVRGGREVLSASVFTQIPLHTRFGGVVPEIAARSHVEKISSVVDEALQKAGVTLGEVDAVAVTYGPGLVGALLVGLSYAKTLALAENKPLIGVNHIAGHIAANYLTYKELEPPFVCLVASGGHSHIVLVEGYNTFKLLGCTKDDAAGEAFDKVARVLGLPYPGGPALEKLAVSGNPNAFTFPIGLNEKNNLDFSFSGTKTAVINLIHTASQRNETLNFADVAASFQKTVVSALAQKSVRAAKLHKTTKLALSGGVSANSALRNELKSRAEAQGVNFFCPDMRFCTDNAAMIACAGHYYLLENNNSPLSLNAVPNLELCNA